MRAVSRRPDATLWLALCIIVMVVIDAVWGRAAGLTIRSLGAKASEIGVSIILTTTYLWFRPNSRLLEMGRYVVLWVCFSTAAAVLTYLCATLDFPLRDAFFRRCDQVLGFDRNAWTRLMQSSQFGYHVLELGYNSLVPQIAGTILWLAHIRARARNAEFLSAAIVSLVLASVLSAVLPAIGPLPADNPALTAPPLYVTEILAMRAHQPIIRNIFALQGIIYFPSYHTVLALLIIWAHRRLVSFWPITVVNGFMLLSVPSVGNHYLIDMVGGMLLAIVSLGACNMLQRSRSLRMRRTREIITCV